MFPEEVELGEARGREQMNLRDSAQDHRLRQVVSQSSFQGQ